MEKVDIAIIGAGVVGLAIAAEFEGSGKEIIVVERHDGFGREASSRNSEVIHAGIYYQPGSLKASLCVEGRRILYELCRLNGISFLKTGKIIIALAGNQVSTLEALKRRGEANGVEGLRLLTEKEVYGIEPDVRSKGGLLSPETGIFDSHGFMAYLEKKASRHTTFAYNCELKGVEKRGGDYVVRVMDADGEEYTFMSRIVINAAGLGAEKVARMAGMDTEKAGYTIHPCKGEYFRVWGEKARSIRHLIYPPPTTISLGLHTVIDMQGGIKLGPNAFYVDEIDYSVDENHREEFYLSAKQYLPFIREENITPDMAGIRAKLYRKSEPERDFVIRHEEDRGLAGFINLLGIESPGLTASPAIAGHVARMVKGIA